ncbi:helix-turn-helix domain-containing protein [Auraticoccus monumenti]|uniref:helix-turn-helix domain-containing protein n=1 Tax=Auraticoccus monumenti TaxID=675864 RepID=UPI001560CC8B|nr:AraC family transcriptional regulator [Auraticoccus monumenti]
MEQVTSGISYFTTAAGVELLLGRLGLYRYAPHLHDTFVVGAVSSGVATLSIDGRVHHPRVGQLVLCNPLEVHDGSALSGDVVYRSSFPSTAFLQDVVTDGRPGSRTRPVRFPVSVVDDPVGAAMFHRAHEVSRRGDCALEAEERLVETYAYCLARHAGVRTAGAGRTAGPVGRAVTLLSDRYADRITLADLVAEAGVPRHRLITAFRRQVGLTPHAYLVSRRTVAAKALLRGGEKSSDVAARTGFADQAHLTRTFKAHFGVTPGAYQQAVRAR